MEELARTLSKMFLILVLLFGSPPGASLRDRARRPNVALVMPLRRRDDGAPLAWPEPWPPTSAARATPVAGADPSERVYIPVLAA